MTRDTATGLAPRPLDGVMWDSFAREQMIGTEQERRALSVAHGYDIDVVLAASAEFRRALGGVPCRWMSRGEALHIARAMAAIAATPANQHAGSANPQDTPEEGIR